MSVPAMVGAFALSGVIIGALLMGELTRRFIVQPLKKLAEDRLYELAGQEYYIDYLKTEMDSRSEPR